MAGEGGSGPRCGLVVALRGDLRGSKHETPLLCARSVISHVILRAPALLPPCVLLVPFARGHGLIGEDEHETRTAVFRLYESAAPTAVISIPRNLTQRVNFVATMDAL